MQFWPPDDEHMYSKHIEAWKKTYCKTNFVHQVGKYWDKFIQFTLLQSHLFTTNFIILSSMLRSSVLSFSCRFCYWDPVYVLLRIRATCCAHPLHFIILIKTFCELWKSWFSSLRSFMQIPLPSTFTLDAGLLARSKYSEGPVTGHLDTGFSRFPRVYKQMLRRFPTFQVATTCFSCSPPDLNLVVTDFVFCLHVK